MQVSSRFTIAVHIFACMEYFKDSHKITSDFLAGSVNANPVVIRKIMSQLREADIIRIQRGTGGIELTRDPQDITLLDIFNAVDALEDGRLFHFHENPNTACPVGRNIHKILDGTLEDIQSGLEDKLRGYSLADILRNMEQYVKVAEK